jgi:hypothetical protein
MLRGCCCEGADGHLLYLGVISSFPLALEGVFFFFCSIGIPHAVFNSASMVQVRDHPTVMVMVRVCLFRKLWFVASRRQQRCSQ